MKTGEGETGGGFPPAKDIMFVAGIALAIALAVTHGPTLARAARDRFTKPAA